MPYLENGTYIDDATYNEIINASQGGFSGNMHDQISNMFFQHIDPSQPPDASTLANASPEEWEAEYFVQFDQQEIEDIKQNFSNQINQMDAKYQELGRQATQSVGQKSRETQSQLQSADIYGQEREVSRQRGFAGAGDTTQKTTTAMENITGGVGRDIQDIRSGLKAGQAEIDLQKQSLGLGKERDIRSAYKTYQDQFYSQLGSVEQMAGSDDDGGGGKK